jgi:L-iditol 2-dehydrogenase
MRAATFHAPGDLRVGDVPEPAVGPGQLKLRMRATATCGTDAKIFRHGHHRLDPPQIIGHELAGAVVEVGSGVTGFALGDRVQVIAAVPCGECRDCRAGAMTVCPNQTSMGYQYPGGFAEYLVVPELVLRVDGVNHIPADVSYAEASVTEPLACAPSMPRSWSGSGPATRSSSWARGRSVACTSGWPARAAQRLYT